MKPRVFWLFIDHLENVGGDVWAVQTGRPRRRYLTACTVDCRVPVTTVFRGPTAAQPRAFLRGVGVVRQHGTRVTITAD